MTRLAKSLTVIISLGTVVMGAWFVDARWNQGAAVEAVLAGLQSLDRRVEYNLAVDKLEDAQDAKHKARCHQVTPQNEDRCHELEIRIDRHKRTIRQLEERK